MTPSLMAGLIIGTMISIIILATSISCLFLTKSIGNRDSGLVERNRRIVAAIAGWCTFVVVILALLGSLFGVLVVINGL